MTSEPLGLGSVSALGAPIAPVEPSLGDATVTLLDDTTTIDEATASPEAAGAGGPVFGYDDCGTGPLLDAARELHAAMSSIHAQLLAVIGALGARDDEQVFEGFVLVDWLVVHLGLSRDTARKWADAAAVLRHLPATSALAATGAISWDKLRQATRFAEPCDDAVLADELPRWNEAQLRQLANERCRRERDDTPEDTPRLGFRADRHGRGKYINGWLPNDEAAAVEAALERRAGQMGPEPDTKRWAPLLERLARALAEQSAASLAHDADLDRATVVIHVDDDVLAGIVAGNALIPTGTPISADAARLAACDGRVQFVTEINGVAVGIGDAAQAVPRWLRRQVERRDGRCRCCGRPIHQIHHVRHWVKGGPTDLDNLVGLCWTCHHRVHEGGWTIDGNPEGTLQFRTPQGVTITSTVQPLSRAVRKRVDAFVANALQRRGFAPTPT